MQKEKREKKERNKDVRAFGSQKERRKEEKI